MNNAPTLDETTRRALRDFLARESLIDGKDMKLASGATANFYFDCKRATLNGEFLQGLADWVLSIAASISPPPTAIGGPTLGADFIVAAAVLRAHQHNLPWINGCITRKQAKEHGTQTPIENNPQAPARILVVEDVITSGGSIAQSCDAYLAAGHTIAGMACIIDREAGGREFLQQKYNTQVHPLFTRQDFPEVK